MRGGSEVTAPDAPAVEPALLRLEMYEVPPVFDYRLSELIVVAQERVRCLQEIEVFVDNRKSDPDPDNFFRRIADIAENYRFWRGRRDDEASHWMLKLAFLNDEFDDTENFFRFTERMLFSARLYAQAEREVGAAAALAEGKLRLNEVFFGFLAAYAGQAGPGVKCVRVPFRFAGALLERYEVDLQGGEALIYPSNAFRLLQDLFGELLFQQHRQLREVARVIRQRDPRLVEITAALRQEKKERIYYEETRLDVAPHSVPELARAHFPLCMEEIYNALRRKHMLKHWGRLQLGLFLKGIGLSVENNTALFLNELKQSPQEAKKANEYKYYIEHMYGRKGKKVEYTPWGCQKMAGKSTPAAGDVYGCPFQYYSDAALAKTLRNKGLNDADIEDVLAARTTAYAQGCRRYYQKTHHVAQVRDSIGRHPNGYFASSLFLARHGTDHLAAPPQL